MKFDEFIKNFPFKYEIECHEGGKILRCKNSKFVSIKGVSIKVPDDSSYYFDNDNNLTMHIESEEVDESILLQAMNSGCFEIIDGSLVRKKI